MSRSRILRDERRELAIVTPEVMNGSPEDLGSERGRVLAEAWEAGYADGLELARRSAAEQAEQARASIRRAQLALTEASEKAICAFEAERHHLEREAVALAFALTEAVLARELESSRAPGEEAVARAVSAAPSGAVMTVRLNPRDVAAIGEHPTSEGPPRIVADEAVGPGGCVLEVGSTVVDARLEAALRRIRRVFDEVQGDE